jgi:hypothetical protein
MVRKPSVAACLLASAFLGACLANTNPLGPEARGGCYAVPAVDLGPMGFPEQSGFVIFRSQAQWDAFRAEPQVAGPLVVPAGSTVPVSPVDFSNHDLALLWQPGPTQNCMGPVQGPFTKYCYGQPGTLTQLMTVYDPHGPYPDPQPSPTPYGPDHVCLQEYQGGTHYFAGSLPKTRQDPNWVAAYAYVAP